MQMSVFGLSTSVNFSVYGHNYNILYSFSVYHHSYIDNITCIYSFAVSAIFGHFFIGGKGIL